MPDFSDISRHPTSTPTCTNIHHPIRSLHCKRQNLGPPSKNLNIQTMLRHRPQLSSISLACSKFTSNLLPVHQASAQPIPRLTGATHDYHPLSNLPRPHTGHIPIQTQNNQSALSLKPAVQHMSACISLFTLRHSRLHVQPLLPIENVAGKSKRKVITTLLLSLRPPCKNKTN